MWRGGTAITGIPGWKLNKGMARKAPWGNHKSIGLSGAKIEVHLKKLPYRGADFLRRVNQGTNLVQHSVNSNLT